MKGGRQILVRVSGWPDHLLGSYGTYSLWQLRCPRPITSVCVTEGALVLTAGALICLQVDGLSPAHTLASAHNWLTKADRRTRRKAAEHPADPTPNASR